MNDEKIFFIDVETTGTDPTKHAVVQVSGEIQINGEILEKVDMHFAPHEGAEISPEALKVIGYTEDELLSRNLSSKEAYLKFMQVCSKYVDKYDRNDKMHFVAYNAGFDADFVRAWFMAHGDPYFGSLFFYPPVDVMQLIALRYMHHRTKFPNYKLMPEASKLGLEIDEEKAHDAFYDILITRKLFNAMRRMTGWDKKGELK